MATSLMQFSGSISRDKGVGLLFYLVTKGKDWEKYNGPDAYKPSPKSTTFCDDKEPITLINPKHGQPSTVPQLYRVWRKPCDTCGCWVGFRYLGEVHFPDLSVPIPSHELPKGAEKLTDEEMIKYWFD